MLKQTSIQLLIPTPCHEDWQQMTPCEEGRFCSSCQKTVIDFTSWSDKALYEFFSTQKGKFCGRFTSTQLHRQIAIPHQPHSRLYRIAIACGLTLMFTQLPQAHARVMPVIQWQISRDDKKQTENEDATGVVKGIVYNKNGKRLANTVVVIYRQGKEVGRTVTDDDGVYSFEGLEPGRTYRLFLEEYRHTAEYITDVMIKFDDSTIRDIIKNKKVEPQRYVMGCPRF